MGIAHWIESDPRDGLNLVEFFPGGLDEAVKRS